MSLIQNSVGSNLFRNFYCLVDQQKKDILRNGELSCAFFVSSILVLNKLIFQGHCTVNSTIKDLISFGWIEITQPKVGCILVWEPITFPDGEIHSHIGFYVGNNQAISNSPLHKSPIKHDWLYQDQKDSTKRKVVAIYWHPRLEN